MIRKSQLRILGAVRSPRPRNELIERLEYAPATVMDSLTELDEMGLIDREQKNGRVVVKPTEALCVELYQSLEQAHSHIDFADLLLESTLILLYHLESAKSARELVDVTGLSRATVYRQLKKLSNRAIVLKERRKYKLSDGFETLHEFAFELGHHLHRVRLRNDGIRGRLVWETHDEFLLQTDTNPELESYLRTGLDVFSTYGLDFFTTSERYYFYSPRRESLTPADHCCHVVLIENDARHRKYAMLLLAATQIEEDAIINRARYYGVEKTVAPMVDYLDTRGESRVEQLPPWEEFQSLAEDYDVEL